jgi:Fe-S-cluster containining protein
MFEIKQFLTAEICLECEGCCRFSEQDSIWLPALLDEEIKAVCRDNTAKDSISSSKKIKSFPHKDGYSCCLFDPENNQCKIYNSRPFECRLYPFLINQTQSGTFLAVDLRCPFIKDELEKKEFKDYLNYLISFLSLPVVAFTMKQNPQVFTDYSQDANLKNLATLIF